VKQLDLLKYYSKALFFSTLGFLGLLLLVRYSLNAHGVELLSWQVLSDENRVFQAQDITAPFYKLLRKPSTVVLATTVEKTSKPLYLYLPQVSGSFWAVYSNDHLIGSAGFRSDRTAHFWYKPFLLEVPVNTDRITIELSGVYELGLDIAPRLIEEKETVRFSVLSFLCGDFLSITIGLCITLFLVLYLVSHNMPQNKRRSNRLFATSMLLAAIWTLDLMPFSTMYSASVMLLLRKFFVSSAYFGFACLFTAIGLGFFEKLTRGDLAMVFLNLSAAIILWIAPNNYAFKLITSRLAMTLFLNALYIAYKIFRSYSKILFGFSLFFVLTVLFDAFILLFNLNLKLLSGFGVVSLFFGFSYNLVHEYREMTVRATVSHMKSLIDPLTGAYNRGILVETTFNEKDCFVYLDLNSFRRINDTYGHEVGDKILVLLVNTIRSKIKPSDIVVRMGGDEFLVIVRDCDPVVVEKLFDEVLAEFQNSHELRPTFSYGIKRFEGSYLQTLRAVDMEMYRMKERLKST
jgi:diguanylate cyclase (GGDEF)-like protein